MFCSLAISTIKELYPESALPAEKLLLDWCNEFYMKP
jgi:hypothetical protein